MFFLQGCSPLCGVVCADFCDGVADGGAGQDFSFCLLTLSVSGKKEGGRGCCYWLKEMWRVFIVSGRMVTVSVLLMPEPDTTVMSRFPMGNAW